MKNYEVYEWMLYVGKKCISIRWVTTEKYKDNKIIKVCLVAHGCEKEASNLKNKLFNQQSWSYMFCNVNSICYELAGWESWFYFRIFAGWYAGKRGVSYTTIQCMSGIPTEMHLWIKWSTLFMVQVSNLRFKSTQRPMINYFFGNLQCMWMISYSVKMDHLRKMWSQNWKRYST